MTDVASILLVFHTYPARRGTGQVMPADTNQNTRLTTDASSRLRDLHKRVYRFRALGMGLGLLPIAAVLVELQAGWAAWTWACLLYTSRCV